MMKNETSNFQIGRFLIEQRSFIALIILIAIVSMINPDFFSVDNILNILRQTSVNAIIAVGMTFVILIAGIDLSVGSVLALTGAIAASMVSIELPIFFSHSCGFIDWNTSWWHKWCNCGKRESSGFYCYLGYHDLTAWYNNGLYRWSSYYDRFFE